MLFFKKIRTIFHIAVRYFYISVRYFYISVRYFLYSCMLFLYSYTLITLWPAAFKSRFMIACPI